MSNPPCRPRTQMAVVEDRLQEDSETELIRVVAWQVFSRLPRNTGVELTDMLQAGHLGLLRARRTYRADKDVNFLIYARFRVRGEILDMLRRLDGAPRSVRRCQRAVETGSRELSARLQRTPTDEEIGESLGIGINVIRRNRQVLWAANLEREIPHGTREDLPARVREWATAPNGTPDAIHERNELLQTLLNCVGSLPARARQVIVLYYRQDLTMKQIGSVLSVNESRVSQIHKAALQTISNRMRSAGITAPCRF